MSFAERAGGIVRRYFSVRRLAMLGVAAAAVVAVAFSLLTWVMYTRRARQPACVVPEAEEAQVGQ